MLFFFLLLIYNFQGNIIISLSGVFLHLQDNVVVQDVEGIIQRVDGQVGWPLQTHLCYKHTRKYRAVMHKMYFHSRLHLNSRSSFEGLSLTAVS